MCNAAFAVEGSLHRHIRIHTGEWPFQCTLCDKCFIQASDLHKHTRAHTGEKHFKCTLCNMAFTQPNHVCRYITTSMLWHLCKHMKTQIWKPFKCTLCDKTFTLAVTSGYTVWQGLTFRRSPASTYLSTYRWKFIQSQIVWKGLPSCRPSEWASECARSGETAFKYSLSDRVFFHICGLLARTGTHISDQVVRCTLFEENSLKQAIYMLIWNYIEITWELIYKNDPIIHMRMWTGSHTIFGQWKIWVDVSTEYGRVNMMLIMHRK